MKMKKLSVNLLGIAIIASSCNTNENTTDMPAWLEPDSTSAIEYRLNKDFPLTIESANKKIKSLYPEITDDQIDEYIEKKYLEVKNIAGEKRMHRKSPSNLKLLNPEMSKWTGRGFDATETEKRIVDTILSISKGEGEIVSKVRIKYKFTIDVPSIDVLVGDTLNVWMPIPINSARQSEVKLISTYPEQYILSEYKSIHNTIYFQQPVDKDTTHFEYVMEYVVGAQYFSPEYIKKNIKPYDVSSELYKNYTKTEYPHIISDSLAYKIVGNEKNPFKQSELVFDYIVKNYPWAGAREYSTIECLPAYVLSEGHGDCGQVALLYISLMRTLGVPARWESGWMMHPEFKGLHDWAEVYFEGIGWVPIDVSAGRYTAMTDSRAINYFSTGVDGYRLASNLGVCDELYPEKKYLRSETVDFQMGEVECSKGNLFYPGWNQKLEIISITPVK